METIRSIKGNVHLFLIDLCINIIKRKKKSIPLFYVSPIPHLVLWCLFSWSAENLCVINCYMTCVCLLNILFMTQWGKKKRKIKIVMWILHCFRTTMHILYYLLLCVHIWWLLCYILWDYAANVCMNWICYCYGLFCNDRE